LIETNSYICRLITWATHVSNYNNESRASNVYTNTVGIPKNYIGTVTNFA